MQAESKIENEHIYLRSLQSADASSEYLSWLSDNTINAFLEIRFNVPDSLDELEEFIMRSEESLDSLLLGIFLKEDDRHIGNIKLGSINSHHKTADVGFLIGDKEQWGNGYASQSITLISRYGFRQLGLEKITAGAYAANRGSQKALLKAGFKKEGRLISQFNKDGIRQDGYVFGKINPELISRGN